MTTAEEQTGAFLSTLPAGRSDRRLAFAVLLVSALFFIAAAPFAKTPLAPVAAFIPVYQSALVVNDLITAVLLFGQFQILRRRALLVLALGYLFTALMAATHALTFPGLFAPAGLLGAGPQTTAWLYMFWHGVFPLGVIGYALLKSEGDYRIGGRYQFEGNAGGEILTCEQPHRLKVTWAYGVITSPADISEVEIRLTPAGEGSTVLEMEHTAIVPEDRWAEYGPGAVGVGWDGAMLGLTLHLRGGSVSDPLAWQVSAEGRDFFTRSSVAWGVANEAAGASPEAAATAVANTTAFYAPPAGIVEG